MWQLLTHFTLFRDATGINFILEWQHKLPNSWRADLEAQGRQSGRSVTCTVVAHVS